MNQDIVSYAIKNKSGSQASNIALWLAADLLQHGGCYDIPRGLAFNHSALAHDLRVIQLDTLNSSGRLVFIMLTQWGCCDAQCCHICDITLLQVLIKQGLIPSAFFFPKKN
jgi:hypothetical protein